MERSVVTRYEAKVDGYLANVAKMRVATKDLAKDVTTSATKHKADWDKIGNATLIGGAAIGAVVLGAAKAYMEFEAAMSGVAAVADATAQQQAALGKAAIQAGQDTVFSATEAAKAEAELAKAGVSVADILGGGLKGSLDLAAAGQIDLAKSAEISAQAMNIFNLEGRDVGHIADVLTAGANKSAAGVDDLGMALQQGGLVAKQTGLSLEDTVGTLSAFADNALKGSDAGTSLKTMLQRLNPQSDEAAGLMDELGLRAYDAQGNFVGVAEYAGQLQTALKGMSAEQRNAALQTLFGSDAVRGANVLYEQGEAGIRKYIAAVNDEGAAARMARKMTDNLKGDLEQLKGTLESAFINGGKGGNEGLRSLVQQVTDLANSFNRLPPAVQSGTVQVAAATAGILLLAGAGIKGTTSILAMKASMEAAGVSSGRFARGMGVAALALAAVAAESAAFEAGGNMVADWLGSTAVGVEQATSEILKGTGASRAFKDALDDSTSAGSTYASAAEKIVPVTRLLGGGLDDARTSVTSYDAALASLVQSGNPEKAAAFLRDAGISAERAKDELPGYAAALADADNQQKLAGDSAQGVSKNLDKVAAASEKAKGEVDDYVASLVNAGMVVLSRRDAERQLRGALREVDDQLKKNGRTTNERTKEGRDNVEFLDGLANKHLAVSKAVFDQTGSEAKFRDSQKKGRASLIQSAIQLGMTKTQATAYANSIIKIPAAKTTKFTLKTAGYSQLKAAGEYLAGLRDKRVTLTVGTVRVGNTKVNAGQFAGGGAVFGAGTATSDSIDAKLSNGEHVLTAAEVTKAGGHDAIYRMRRGINAGALKFANGGAVGPAKFADGGEVDWADILDIVGDKTVWADVAKARGTASSRAASAKSARASLLALRAQMTAVNAAIARAKKTRGRGDDNAALEKRRVLMAKIAASEDRYALALSKSKDAARLAKVAVDEYDRDRRPLIDRTLSASKASNTKTKSFLDNIDKLTRMGFKTLALALLDQGGPEAETLAAQAVKSASKAKSLQAQLSSSASLDAREAAIRAALGGGSAGADLSSTIPALGWYSQVRDLGPMARRGAPSVAPGAGTTIKVEINGPVDPMAAGRQFEDVLQKYAATTGRPIQVRTMP